MESKSPSLERHRQSSKTGLLDDVPQSKGYSDHSDHYHTADAKQYIPNPRSAKKKASHHHPHDHGHKVSSDPFDLADEKRRISEIQQDIEADEEFEQLKNKPTETFPAIAQSPHARKFVNGFQM